jgi:hypothetical protein
MTIVACAALLISLGTPATARATQIGDLVFLFDDFFGATLTVNNSTTGALTDLFTSVEITLVDADDQEEHSYGYDESLAFVAGVPAVFAHVAAGGFALFDFGALSLDPEDYLGAYVTVAYGGDFVSSCEGSDPSCLVSLAAEDSGNFMPLNYTAVPEPGTMLLVGAGCAVIGLGRRTLRARRGDRGRAIDVV